MMYSIQLDGHTISYSLERKKVKNINLRIKADQSVYVSANEAVTLKEIEDLLQSKSEYILRSLDHYAEHAKYAHQPKQYVNGESFRLLGHDLRLKVEKGSKNQVASDESYLILTVKDPSDKQLKQRVMNRWINQYCKIVVEDLCHSVYPKFQKYDVAFPEIRFRNMVSCWGSCQPQKGVITFNFALIEAPLACIEYVVIHEFTHFLQPNHSRKFYNQLLMFMPDWQQRKAILEKENIFTE